MGNSQVSLLKGLGLLGLAASLFSHSSHANSFLHFWENRYETHRGFQLSSENAYFRTHENFDADSQTYIPAGLEGYNRFQSDNYAQYGLSPEFSVFGRLSWAYLQVQTTSSLGSTFGLGDQALGATYRIWKNASFALDLQAQADIPAYSNGSALEVDRPFLGDGSFDLSVGAFLTYPFTSPRTVAKWSAQGGLAYQWRSQGYSGEIPWSLTGRYSARVLPEDPGAEFELSLLGSLSLQSDANTPDGRPNGVGGSEASGAINPVLTSARLRARYHFSPRIAVALFGVQSLYGLNAPHGFSAGAQLQLRWDPAPSRRRGPELPSEYGKSNQGFVEYAFDARVIRSNDRMNLVKIDKGKQDGVAIGQIFDIFKVLPDGSPGEAVARAKCTEVRANEAALTVIEYFKEVWIEEGFIAKQPLN